MFNPDSDEEYKFAFLPEEDTEYFKKTDNDTIEYWIKVSRVFDSEDGDMAEISDEIPEDNDIFPHAKRKAARKMLTALYDGLCKVQNVNYYLAKNRSLPDVVDIFVRVNSGGQKLDSSDLMLSIAAGEQGEVDIHKKIQEAVEEINNVPQDVENGFKVDKEMLLTAGLLFTGAEKISLKNSENYSAGKMNEIFKDHWDTIVDALKTAVEYIEYLGFVGKKLSRNAVLPISYYFYKEKIGSSHKGSSSKRADCDRVFIRQWLLRALFNGVFSEGTGVTLLAMRKVLDATTKKHFPLEDLLKTKFKRPLIIDDDQIEDIIDLRYGDTKIIPLFNELEHVSARPNDQVDHIWARAILSSKKEIKKLYPSASEDEIANYKSMLNKLSNLQILDAVVNNEKSDTPFDKWINATYPNDNDMSTYKRAHFIPENISVNFEDFLEFLEKREALLKAKIRVAFPSDFSLLVKRYNLQDKI